MLYFWLYYEHQDLSPRVSWVNVQRSMLLGVIDRITDNIINQAFWQNEVLSQANSLNFDKFTQPMLYSQWGKLNTLILFSIENWIPKLDLQTNSSLLLWK